MKVEIEKYPVWGADSKLSKYIAYKTPHPTLIMYIEKFIAPCDGILFSHKKIPLENPFEMKKGYTYYAFIKEEKAWIRHSGKLTKEEKQWVIESENKKHICFEASHIECSCKDKCLRNINNY